MTARRVLFWFLLALFVGLSVWWCLYFPYNRAQVYRAIPGHAVFASEHEYLADRWPQIASNPLVVCVAQAARGDEESKPLFSENPTVGQTLRWYAPRHVVVAHVPSLGQQGQSAWVLSSWVGGKAQLFKLALSLRLIKGFRSIQAENGWTVWTQSLKGQASPQRLSLTFYEGQLIACLSEDPAAAAWLVERVALGASSAVDWAGRLERARKGRLDGGWVNWFAMTGVGAPETTLEYSLALDEPGRLEGEVRGNVPIPGDAVVGGVTNRLALERLVGDAPEIIAMAPYSLVGPLLFRSNVHESMETVGTVLHEAATESAPLAICLTGDDFSGRILGLKVPTILIGMQVREPTGILDRVAGTLDVLNAKHGLGLIPSRVSLGNYQEGIGLDSSRGNVYASLKPGERPVCGVVADWMVISSNVDALRRLMDAARTRRGDAARPRWACEVDEVAGSVGHFGVDFESANQALRNGIAVYSLALLAQSREGGGDTRQRLDNARTWVNALRALKRASFWVSREPDGFKVEFRAGDGGPLVR